MCIWDLKTRSHRPRKNKRRGFFGKRWKNHYHVLKWELTGHREVQTNNILAKTEGNYIFAIFPLMDCLLFSNTHRSRTSALPLSSCFSCLQLWQSKATLPPKHRHAHRSGCFIFLHVPGGIVQPFFPGIQGPLGCHCPKAGLEHPLGKAGSLSWTSCRHCPSGQLGNDTTDLGAGNSTFADKHCSNFLHSQPGNLP